MRKAWTRLAVGAIVSMSRHAGAETTPPPIDLAWEAPAECPDAAFVRDRIEHILRAPVTDRNSAVAHGKVSRSYSGRYRLVMSVQTGDLDDARTIEAASCRVLAQAFAVVVALAIHPTRTAETLVDSPTTGEVPAPARPASPPPGPGFPPPQAAPEKDAVPPTARAREGASPRWPHVAIGLGGSLVFGSLPNPSAGVVASVTLRFDRLRVGVLGSLALRQSPHFDEDAGATFDMVEGGLFGGYMVPFGAFAVGPCANVEATYVRARGFGLQSPATTSGVWPTLVAGARLEAHLAESFGLFARADVLFALGAPRFSLETAEGALRLHSPGPVAPRLSLGAEFVLP